MNLAIEIALTLRSSIPIQFPQNPKGRRMNEMLDPVPAISSSPGDRVWAMLCHLGTFVTWIPFANFVVPLIIWMIKKDQSPLVNDQGKEALNFQITVAIGYAICIPLLFVLIGLPLIIVLGIFHVVFSIVAAIKSYDGKAYRYPCTLRLIT